MKNHGKIAFIAVVAIWLAVAATWVVVNDTHAATGAQTFVLPSSSTVTHTANTYIILWDKATGNLVADAGTIAAGNTWTGGDIATAVHAQNGTVWIATIPALDDNYTYVMAIYDAASPAKTDVPTAGPFLYDPDQNITFSDTNPIRRKNVGVKTQ